MLTELGLLSHQNDKRNDMLQKIREYVASPEKVRAKGGGTGGKERRIECLRGETIRLSKKLVLSPVESGSHILRVKLTTSKGRSFLKI